MKSNSLPDISALHSIFIIYGSITYYPYWIQMCFMKWLAVYTNYPCPIWLCLQPRSCGLNMLKRTFRSGIVTMPWNSTFTYIYRASPITCIWPCLSGHKHLSETGRGLLVPTHPRPSPRWAWNGLAPMPGKWGHKNFLSWSSCCPKIKIDPE